MAPRTLNLTLKGTLFAALAAGCYHAEPLDTRELLNELRRSDPLPVAPAKLAGTAKGALTEEQTIALALSWNPDLRALRATRGIAEGEVATASELSNPILRTELTHVQRGWDGVGWDLRLSWVPPQPGVYGARKGAAKAHVDQVEKEISEREWSLSCDVREAHAALLAVEDEIRVAADTVINRKKLAELVERRTLKGGSTRFDIDLTQLSLANAQRLEDDLRVAQTNASTALVKLLGVGPPSGGVVAVGVLDDADATAALPTQSDLEDRAVTDRPALAAAKAGYQVAEQTLRAETAARWPWIALAAIPRIRRNEFAGSITDVTLGVDVGLPILNTNKGRVQSAKAAREAARLDVATALVNVRTDIARALADIAGQRIVLQRLHVQIEPLLKEHDRLLATAAQASELDLPAMVQSEDLVLQARTQLIATRMALRKAQIALERAVGARLIPVRAH